MEDFSQSREELIDELNRLRKQISQYRSLVENSRDLMYRMSLPDGSYEYISPAVESLFGYTAEEFYEKPEIFKSIIHPDWFQYFREHWELMLAGTVSPTYEYQIIHKSGGTRWMNQRNTLIKDSGGNPVAIEGIVTNITERKHAEEALRKSENRLQEAQKLAKMGSWYWNIKTGEVKWSDEIFQIFKLDPKEFTPQIDSIMALSPWPEDNQRNTEIMQKAIESHESGSYEQRFLYPDGDTGYYQSTYEGIFDTDGNITAIRGIIQDITNRKRAEEERNRLEEEYRQIQKTESIGRLAGGVAHDLNNLLSPIIGFSELLMEDIPEEDNRRESVEEIINAGLMARDLVQQLLAFSRKQTLEYAPLDLNKAIRDFEKLLRRTIREDISLYFKLGDGIRQIMADISQIEQVVMNLAVNAADAMPDGGNMIIETAEVTLDDEYSADHPETKPGDYIMLSVSDSGSGMDEDVRRHIFEPFYSTKGKLGTGLGMATVYGIVKQHEGSIWVYSEPGIGTTIKVYLPVTDISTAEKDSTESSGKRTEGSETILLVEDNDTVRKLAYTILKKYGYSVLSATGSQEALSISSAHDGVVDLLLTDVVMPGINGKELYGKIRENRPGLKVLFMSGYTDNVIAHRGILDDDIQFIQKPFTVSSLISKVKETLGS